MSTAIQHIDLDGADVSLKGEMVSLTGLWKAAGSDPSKKPAKWRELPSTQEFAAHVADVIIRKSDIELFAVTRGGKAPGTWAHWQIAMSYARYLDPAFAARCNEIVRERMEEKAVVPAGISSEILEMIRRTDGIARQLSGKFKRMEAKLDSALRNTANENGPAEVAASPSHGSNSPR
ncbi:KilA-N domain-containing protein [Fulvimarina manganoxydans]|uniref:KilA-N domain-containing protein n=1 Tax=Fulvimarina manganoxydans TaxID=937218 RepID=A0A1W2BCU9_9HYPH|nr:KilA-N domain-containing protein [Fulvimarina manganoxydans]SMC70542.1 KilA-N domain-containing protein [Fulvimarina manganoxydans]